MANRTLWIILAVALLLRSCLLVASWGQGDHFLTPDSHDYNLLAHTLLEKGQFTRTGQPELFRTPGYPVFLAGMYALSGGRVELAVAVQIVLDVLLCWLVYRLGCLLCSRGVGLAAAAVQAISPVAIMGAVRILSEGMFALLLTVSLVLLVELYQRKKLWLALAAGLALGLGCLVRPIGLPLALLAAIVLVASRPRMWKWAAVFCLGVGVLVGPWMLRNRQAAGYFQLAGVGDYNLFYCNAVVMLNAYPDTPLTDSQEMLLVIKNSYAQWPTGQPQYLNDPVFLRQCRQEGSSLILHHPVQYGIVHFKTAWNIFLPSATDVLEVLGVTSGGKGTLAVLQQRGLVAAVRHYFGGNLWPLYLSAPMLLVTACKYALALAGVFLSVRRRMPVTWWLLFVSFLYLAFTPGPVALPRFRVPIAPLISLAAGVGIVWLAKRRQARPGLKTS